MVMQIQQLAYVVAVADTLHFTQAAQLLEVAQPTLSKQIRVLEDELGTPLFERTRGNITLTQAGELLVPLARRVLADVDTARRQVRELAGLQRGRVRLGATPSLITGLLADALADFRSALPDIALHVQESGSQDLVRRLQDGDLDMALLIASRHTADPALVSTPLLREDLVVVSSADSPPPTTGDSMRVSDLRHHPLVMFRQGYDLRTVTLQACRDAGFEPRLAIEGGEMDAVLASPSRTGPGSRAEHGARDPPTAAPDDPGRAAPSSHGRAGAPQRGRAAAGSDRLPPVADEPPREPRRREPTSGPRGACDTHATGPARNADQAQLRATRRREGVPPVASRQRAEAPAARWLSGLPVVPLLSPLPWSCIASARSASRSSAT
jgi:DNA-binding transcriptional LysR family regulator